MSEYKKMVTETEEFGREFARHFMARWAGGGYPVIGLEYFYKSFLQGVIPHIAAKTEIIHAWCEANGYDQDNRYDHNDLDNNIFMLSGIHENSRAICISSQNFEFVILLTEEKIRKLMSLSDEEKQDNSINRDEALLDEYLKTVHIEPSVFLYRTHRKYDDYFYSTGKGRSLKKLRKIFKNQSDRFLETPRFYWDSRDNEMIGKMERQWSEDVEPKIEISLARVYELMVLLDHLNYAVDEVQELNG